MKIAVGKGPKTVSNVTKKRAKHGLFRPNIITNGDWKLTNACPKKLNSTNQGETTRGTF